MQVKTAALVSLGFAAVVAATAVLVSKKMESDSAEADQ